MGDLMSEILCVHFPKKKYFLEGSTHVDILQLKLNVEWLSDHGCGVSEIIEKYSIKYPFTLTYEEGIPRISPLKINTGKIPDNLFVPTATVGVTGYTT